MIEEANQRYLFFIREGIKYRGRNTGIEEEAARAVMAHSLSSRACPTSLSSG